MQKKISSIPFSGTPEQEAKLKEAIARHKDDPGAVMPVLQEAQEIYGYLPIEVQTMVAEGLNVSLEEVYGVSTFYSQFALSPKGKYNISVCLGTACYVKGAQALIDETMALTGAEINSTSENGIFSLDATRCLGACGLAPVCVIDGKVFGNCTKETITAEINKIKAAEKIA